MFWAFISGVNGQGSCLPSHLGAEQLEEEGQLLELRLVSELGSEGVVQLVERSGSVCLGVTSRNLPKINRALKFCFVVELEIPP